MLDPYIALLQTLTSPSPRSHNPSPNGTLREHIPPLLPLHLSPHRTATPHPHAHRPRCARRSGLGPKRGYSCHRFLHIPQCMNELDYSHGPKPYTCMTCTGVVENCCWRISLETLDPKSCTLSVQCHCWRFPDSLLLVNRAFNKEANRIFFSSNHFNILPYGGSDGSILLFREPSKMLAMPPFVTRLPFCALKRLRSMQFVFLYFRFFLVEPSTAAAWRQSIQLLATHADLPKLTLTLDLSMARKLYDPYDGEGEQEAWDWWEPYERDFALVVQLGKAGLKDFWVHLAWPLHGQDAVEKRLRWERELEARVMGQEYDAEAMGKWKVKGRWTEDERD